MPTTFTHPGIYVEELPSGVHPIAGASTSDTAFVDYFPRGTVGQAVRVSGLTEFLAAYGGADPQSMGSYAVPQYFLNGGQTAWIVRVTPTANPATATLTLTGSSPPQATLRIDAANPGSWGKNVQVAPTATVPPLAGAFNLFVREVDSQGRVVGSEVYRNLSMAANATNYAVDVVNAASALVHLSEPPSGLGAPPNSVAQSATGDPTAAAWLPLSPTAAVADSTVIDNTGHAVAGFATALQTSLPALDRIAPFRFNLLCLPGTWLLDGPGAKATIDAAAAYAGQQRAFLIVDPPPTAAAATAMFALSTGAPAATPDAALYFPGVDVADPLAPGRTKSIGASGTVAGIYARTDADRGTWKARAGIDAGLVAATPSVTLNDDDSSALNPLGINALRTFPGIGSVVWGARTLFGSDQRASEWKYVPIRRMARYIENSLVDGLTWVVFEPNDETLWGQIRLNVGAFMQDLFRQDAFQGTTPRDAYVVKCDSTTTTQSDIDRGIVNILVGFAPLKPAEFVVIQIQQLAGQTQA